MKRGIVTGLIAGFVSALVILVINPLMFRMGLIEFPGDIEFWSSVIIIWTVASFSFSMIWGAILGVIYVMFYDRIPGKGITKGLVYSLIIYLISNVRLGSLLGTYGEALWAKIITLPGFLVIITYGIVLGYLYKPPK